MGVESEMQMAVEDMLGYYLFDDAVLLCERLCDEFGGLPNTLLLASCYMRAGRFGTVVTYLRSVCGHLISGAFQSGSMVEWRVRYTFVAACVQMRQFNAAVGCFEGMENLATPGLPHAALAAMKRVCYAGLPGSENYGILAAAAYPPLLYQFEASIAHPQPQGPAVPLLTCGGCGPHALSIYNHDSPSTQFLRPFAECIAASEMYNFRTLKAMSASVLLERHKSFTSLLVGVGAANSAQTAEAAGIFAAFFRDHPWKLADPSTIVYSNCLWQLKELHALGSLSHQVVSELGRHPIALAVTANYYSLEGEVQSAISTLRQAIALDDRLAPVHILLGLELLHSGCYGEAARCFQTAIRYAPSSYLAYTGLGDVARATKTDPIPMYERAIVLNQHPYPINKCAAELLERNRFRDALALMNQAIEINPQSVSCRSSKAQILAALDQIPEALAEFKHILSLEPGEADTWYNYGRCCLQLGRTAEAAVALNHAVVLDPRRQEEVQRLLPSGLK